MRLSPLDPIRWWFQAGIGQAYSNANRYDEAVEWQERALRTNPNLTAVWRGLAVAYVRLNRWDDARRAAHKILEASPGFTVSKWREQGPTRPGPRREQFLDDLRRAGLPE
jgi:tetratricopeptide (TPR) repeat protein